MGLRMQFAMNSPQCEPSIRSMFLIFATPHERPRMLTNDIYVCRSLCVIANWWRIAFVSPFAIYSPLCERCMKPRLSTAGMDASYVASTTPPSLLRRSCSSWCFSRTVANILAKINIWYLWQIRQKMIRLAGTITEISVALQMVTNACEFLTNPCESSLLYEPYANVSSIFDENLPAPS